MSMIFSVCVIYVILSFLIVIHAFASKPTLPYQSWAGKNVMFISAHPDDIEYCSGALVQYLTEELSPPANISYIILTNGNAGGNCVANFSVTGSQQKECSAMQLAAEREQEAMNAATYLNVNAKYVQILDYDDSMLKSYPEEDIRENLVIVVRTYKPEIIISFYPYIDFLAPMNGGSYQGYSDLGYHPDHQYTGLLTIDTIYGPSSRDNRIFGELYNFQHLEAWSVNELYLWRFSNNLNAPITNCIYYNQTFMNKKLNSYYKHESQISNATWFQLNLKWIGEQLNIYCGGTGQNGNTYAEAYMSYY